MPAYAVFRIKKLKSWGDVAACDAHNFRTRETPNADPAKSPENLTLLATSICDSASKIKQSIEGQRIRKNAVLAVEILMSASPAYFRPSEPEKAGSYDASRMHAWADTSMQWLKEKYGSRLIKAVVHVDEATPHLHALLVPLDNKGKLNCRALFGGSRHTLTELQSEYAKTVAPLGIERGLQGSRAKHQEIAKFYAATQHSSCPEIPLPQESALPELPGKVERLSDAKLIQFAEQIVTAQQEAAKPVLTALAGENALLKRQAQELRAANAALVHEKAVLKQEADKVRGLPLPEVLIRMYGAIEAKGSKPGDGTRVFTLPDGAVLGVRDNEWADKAKTMRGKGAINLVMRLNGYGQEKFQQAVRELAEYFGEDKARKECANALAGRAEQITRDAMLLPVATKHRDSQEQKKTSSPTEKMPQKDKKTTLSR